MEMVKTDKVKTVSVVEDDHVTILVAIIQNSLTDRDCALNSTFGGVST